MPIAYGIAKSNLLYAVFALMIAVILVRALLSYFPALSLIALLPMPLAFFAWQGAIEYGENIAASILTPLLLGVSLVYG